MKLTVYDDVNQLVNQMVETIQAILGKRLVGIYLHGSLVVGDFDPRVSDIDMLVVSETLLDDHEFAAIKQMHDAIATQYPQWKGRIETQYYTPYGLKTYMDQASPMANISPGEPFHMIEAGHDWLMNWYVVREFGKTLYGRPPESLIAAIPTADFVQCVRDYVEQWRGYKIREDDTLGYQAYAILALCRALYAQRHGTQVSKKQAGLWTTVEFPQWAEFIQKAIAWREMPHNNQPVGTRPETVEFVQFMLIKLDGE